MLGMLGMWRSYSTENIVKRWLFVLVLFSATSAYAQTQPVTVILARHGEKMAQPADNPPLSAEGQIRAEDLLKAVRDAGITAIYSTPYLRTTNTAKVVADALKLSVTETPIAGRNVAAYGDSVAARAKRDGGVILVVGHSNTMGAVIKSLGGPDIGEIADPEYDNLFVMTVQDGKPARLVRAKYGRRVMEKGSM
jgi:broad specificity phosphatase PhoE